jgi:hypothetical protein
VNDGRCELRLTRRYTASPGATLGMRCLRIWTERLAAFEEALR